MDFSGSQSQQSDNSTDSHYETGNWVKIFVYEFLLIFTQAFYKGHNFLNTYETPIGVKYEFVTFLNKTQTLITAQT